MDDFESTLGCGIILLLALILLSWPFVLAPLAVGVTWIALAPRGDTWWGKAVLKYLGSVLLGLLLVCFGLSALHLFGDVIEYSWVAIIENAFMRARFWLAFVCRFELLLLLILGGVLFAFRSSAGAKLTTRTLKAKDFLERTLIVLTTITSFTVLSGVAANSKLREEEGEMSGEYRVALRKEADGIARELAVESTSVRLRTMSPREAQAIRDLFAMIKNESNRRQNARSESNPIDAVFRQKFSYWRERQLSGNSRQRETVEIDFETLGKDIGRNSAGIRTADDKIRWMEQPWEREVRAFEQTTATTLRQFVEKEKQLAERKIRAGKAGKDVEAAKRELKSEVFENLFGRLFQEISGDVAIKSLYEVLTNAFVEGYVDGVMRLNEENRNGGRDVQTESRMFRPVIDIRLLHQEWCNKI